MIKILLIPTHISEDRVGGIRMYNENLASLFHSEQNFDIRILPNLPYDSILGIKYNLKELENAIIEYTPNIIHVNGYTSQLLRQIIKLKRKYNYKIVYTPHWHPFNTMRKSLLKKVYFNIFIKPYLKKIEAIIAINNEDYNYFSKYSNKIHKIPHWIKEDSFNNYSVEKNRNQILFIGSLQHPNKGFQLLYNLPKDKYRIVCVGQGDVQLRSDMIQLKKVSQIELRKLYSQSSVVLIPSRYEAFSYVALEALNAGIPIVMSERVRIADYLQNFDGIKIFNLNSPQQLIDSVDEMIGKTFNNSIVKTIFSKENALKAYTNLYTSI